MTNNSPKIPLEPLSVKAIVLGVLSFFGIFIAVSTVVQFFFVLMLFSTFDPASSTSSSIPAGFAEIIMAGISMIALVMLLSIPILAGYVTGIFAKYRAVAHCWRVGANVSILFILFFLAIVIFTSNRFEVTVEAMLPVITTIACSLLIVPLVVLGGYFYERRNSAVLEDKQVLQEYFD